MTTFTAGSARYVIRDYGSGWSASVLAGRPHLMSPCHTRSSRTTAPGLHRTEGATLACAKRAAQQRNERKGGARVEAKDEAK